MGNAKDKKVKTKALKNDFWMLGLIWRFTPSYVILCLIDGVFLGINSCIGMLFIKYLLNFLTNNSGLGKISNLVIAYGLYIAIFNMFFYWFYQVFLPYTKEKLHREMCSSMFLKAVSLDLEKYYEPVKGLKCLYQAKVGVESRRLHADELKKAGTKEAEMPSFIRPDTLRPLASDILKK